MAPRAQSYRLQTLGALLDRYFARLPEGPIDLVGDVHGEIAALRDLIRHLGYDADGRHADRRRLVFVGDLTDRGPDSPAVLDLVRRLIDSDRARCVLGNHELNLLREDAKDGNGWAFAENHDTDKGRYGHSRAATVQQRAEYLSFLRTLPLTLENSELRVVHACWHAEALESLHSDQSNADLVEAFSRYEIETSRRLAEDGLADRANSEGHRHAASFADPDASMPMLHAIALADERRQMGNPLRILTAGVERPGRRPFWSAGAWRFVDRVAWWNEYRDQVPVVIGHYWRRPVELDCAAKDAPGLFGGAALHDWLGPRRNVFCVDFSVGRRFRERELGQAPGTTTKLAALRWPERTLVFDDGSERHTN